MEKITIEFKDKTKYNLPDISYDNFTNYMFENGCSDVEYDNYCEKKNMKNITDFNNDATKKMVLIVKNENRIIKFKCIYDSDNKI